MKIVLATPLYPPDVYEPAPYVKELARRLAKSHEVTIVAYGRLPEQVPGVRIVPIRKERPLPFRLLSFTRTLLRETHRADILYVVNGASVELPLLLVFPFVRAPVFLAFADRAAHACAPQRFSTRVIERFAARRAKNVVTELPPERPEILPLEEVPTEALRAYEEAWRAHIATLESLFDHARS